MKNKKIFILIFSVIFLIGIFEEGKAATCAGVGGICTGVGECHGFGGSCRSDSPLDCPEPCCCIIPPSPPSPHGLIPCGGAGQPECSLEQISILIGNIINFLLLLAGGVAVLMLIIGGIYFLIAGADPEKIEMGKKVITAVIIALLIIFLAKVLLNAFLTAIGAGGI